SILIEEKRFYGDLDDYLEVLSTAPKYRDTANEMKKIVEKIKTENLAAEQSKLRITEPYEGMTEDNINLSAWGPPTEINKDINYDSLSDNKRVKHYKWIEKDSNGRIIKIKTLMVKQGSVWGVPRTQHYYQKN